MLSGFYLMLDTVALIIYTCLFTMITGDSWITTRYPAYPMWEFSVHVYYIPLVFNG